jgi:hypothetical protein
MASELWLEKWLPAFLRSSELYSICRRIKDIIVISGSQYLDEGVRDLLLNISKRTEKTGPYITLL